MPSESLRIFITLLEGTSLFLVASYFYCWAPRLPPLAAGPLRRRSKLTLYVFFSAVSIMGTLLGVEGPGGWIANNRAVGSVLAGIIGGPWLGLLVGATAGAHRLWLGGATATAGIVATVLEGLLGGATHLALRRKPERLVDWRIAAGVTAAGEAIHMMLVLLLAADLDAGFATVRLIGPPMILTNSIGAALFMTVLHDRQEVYEKIATASSAFALKVAERTLGLMTKGFGREVAVQIARIIREETGVGAVGITDTERILAFDGLGADHHVPGLAIFSVFTRRAIATRQVVFADGVHERFRCPIRPDVCPLHSVVVVPLYVDDNVVGSVQLCEPEARRFRTLNRALGEGIGALLSAQLVMARYQEQKSLLVTSELKLLQAQVNPHFLFNSLNTLIAVTRTDPERARELLGHLSTFFRKNLKRSSDVSTLQEELEHVGSYLEIEKARFQDRLVVETEVDPALLPLQLPTFTLQPLIENAIRHGLSATMSQGRARICAYRRADDVLIEIEDNAGTFAEPADSHGGLGMKIVDKRIKNLFGDDYGLVVHCVPHELTRVTVRLPAAGSAARAAS